MESLAPWGDRLLNWAANGLLDLSAWQIVLVTLLLTHITIASVTIFLHRAQAHRALELHAIPSHFFRFWLWLTTGQITKEWVAVHRKHHAKCETAEDPHSPITHGIKKVLLEGAELYRVEAHNKETVAKYGHNTPDDWLERTFYTGRPMLGISLMLIINVLLFGAIGITVWAVQMAWIPITAAGIINGAGHYWGYRNFENEDAATNISPWGILIGGEELHNNHHTYPTSAKLSVKPFEFDIGWLYISLLSALGLAKVRKVPPQLKMGELKPQPDGKTLEALIANRYALMAQYGQNLRAAVEAEMKRIESEPASAGSGPRQQALKAAHRWLHRNDDRIPERVKPTLATAVAGSDSLTKLVQMRDELAQMWTRTNVSADQLVTELQAWCKRAEESGIASLREFALRVRTL